jgi:uncharacterized protein YdcH (DUF465 family)
MDLKRYEDLVAGEPMLKVPRQDFQEECPSSPTTKRKSGFFAPSWLQWSNIQVTNSQREIMPMDLHHPILREFPEHRDTIRRLKGSDDHFRSLFEEYHRLDDEIYRIEEEIDFANDQEIEELKMRRAKLKDYIYHVIRHAPEACPACEGTGLAR